MKLKVLFLALFVAGIAASFAVAKPPPGKGSNGGNGKGHDKNAVTAPAGSTTVADTATTTATTTATLPASGKVVLCHRTGKATKWVRISIGAKAAKQRIAKGDVWLQDPAGTCVGAAAGTEDHGSTTTGSTTTTAATASTAATTTTTP